MFHAACLKTRFIGVRPAVDLRRAHIVASTKGDERENCKIVAAKRRQKGNKQDSFNDNTTAKDEWLRQGAESSEQNRTLSGR